MHEKCDKIVRENLHTAATPVSHSIKSQEIVVTGCDTMTG